METIKTQIKTMSLILSVFILLQSCTAYKSTSVTVEEAAKEQIKTKIETNNGSSVKFKYIDYQNGNYFGIRKFKGEIQKIELNEEHITSIRLKNKATSTILTVLAITIPVAIIIFNASNRAACKTLFGSPCRKI